MSDPYGTWKSTLGSIQDIVSSGLGFAERLREADRISQYSSGLASMDTAFGEYNRALTKKRWDTPSVDLSGIEVKPGGGSTEPMQYTLGQIDEGMLARDYQDMVKAQRDHITATVTNKAARTQLLQDLEREAATRYNQVAEVYGQFRQYQMEAASTKNIDAYKANPSLSMQGKLDAIERQLNFDVEANIRWAPDAADMYAKAKTEIEASDAMGKALEAARKEGWSFGAAMKALDEETPYWEPGNPDREDMRKTVLNRITSERQIQREIDEDNGRRVYALAVKAISADWRQISRDQLLEWESTVDDAHKPEIRAYREKHDKYTNQSPEQVFETRWQGNEFQLRAARAAWIAGGRQGPSPLSTDAILSMSTPGADGTTELDTERADRLMGMAEQDAKDMAPSPEAAAKAADPKAIFAAGIESRLYAAVARADAQDPWLQVKDGEIEQALKDGNITPEKHNELLALRFRLHTEFVNGDTRGKTTAEGESEAYRIVYNKTLSVQDKYDQIRGLELAGRLSGPDAATWTGRVDSYNGDIDRKRLIDDISNYYERSARNASTEKAQELSRDLIKARETMEQWMRDHPDKATWDEARNRILGEAATKDLTATAVQVFGGTTGQPATFAKGFAEGGGGAWRTVVQWEAMREIGELPPDLQAKLAADQSGKRDTDIEVLVNVGLMKGKRDPLYSVPITTGPMAGETLYSPDPIQFDNRTKQPIPPKRSFVVRYVAENGKITPEVQKLGVRDSPEGLVEDWQLYDRWKE